MHFLVDELAGKTYVASSMALGQMRSSVSDPGKNRSSAKLSMTIIITY
jgi:hypothetical protein